MVKQFSHTHFHACSLSRSLCRSCCPLHADVAAQPSRLPHAHAPAASALRFLSPGSRSASSTRAVMSSGRSEGSSTSTCGRGQVQGQGEQQERVSHCS